MGVGSIGSRAGVGRAALALLFTLLFALVGGAGCRRQSFPPGAYQLDEVFQEEIESESLPDRFTLPFRGTSNWLFAPDGTLVVNLVGFRVMQEVACSGDLRGTWENLGGGAIAVRITGGHAPRHCREDRDREYVFSVDPQGNLTLRFVFAENHWVGYRMIPLD